MAAAYRETFAPRVIAAPHIQKWAHYARFERRVFGPDVVRGLNCTFELARGLPYYRLPLRSLKFATLVDHLFGRAIDKSYQKADWGHRPLSAEELDYAAWDPEWCYRIHQGLQPLMHSWDPATDDPNAIQRRYVEILPGLRDAKQGRTAIWDVVKAFMVAGERERFSDRGRLAAGRRGAFDRTARKVPAGVHAAPDRRPQRVYGWRPDPGLALAARSDRGAYRDRPVPRLAWRG
jgi:ribonuclease D